MSGYLLGLITLPALALGSMSAVVAVALVDRSLRSRGWHITRSAEVGEEWDYSFSRRHVRRHLRIFWTGTFVNDGVSTCRFFKIANAKHGVCFARVREVQS